MTVYSFLAGYSKDGNANTSYPLNTSLRLRNSASAYLNRTYSTSPTSTTKQTFSFWVKRGLIGSSLARYPILGGYDGSSGNNMFIDFGGSSDVADTIGFWFGGGSAYQIQSTAVFRDPSSWYHVVCAVDTTQATASNRVLIYVNGVQITSFYIANYPAQNAVCQFAQANANNKIGCWWSSTSPFFDGYLAEVNFIDGQALTPSAFGAYDIATGVWQPSKYTGTYGNNGFYLPFSNTTSTTTLGYDFSGNGNNWTCNNISLTAGSTYDAMTDVPTLTSSTASNYCVINPLDHAGTAATISNGNLYYVGSASSVTRSTLGITNAKVYWEITQVSSVNGSNPIIYGSIGLNGVVAHVASSQSVLAYTDNGSNKAFRLTNSSGITSTITPSSFTLSVGDVLQIAYDGTTGKIWIGKNNTYYDGSGGTTGNPSTGANAVFTVPDLTNPMAPGFDHAGVSYTCTLNCGQQPFAYTPPTGFIALNTYNLPTPAIANGALYNAATLYTGTGSSQSPANSQSNGGNNALGKTFEPDLTWIKSRSAATDHKWTDTVRGVTKALVSDSTSAETTDTNGLTAFSSNGFTVGTDTNYNNSGATYVAWQWNAGSGTSGSNTNGSITSTVSANTTAGFSVVTWAGNNGTNATVGHGLGSAPALIITKNRSGVSDWPVYHSSLTSGYTIFLDTVGAQNNSSSWYGSNAPTSSVFYTTYVGNISINASGNNYVSYCWAAIAGYSAFGSYTGNGSTDGPFVYCGFRPRFVLFKCSSTPQDWVIYDTSRDTYNAVSNYLLPDSSAAEAVYANADFLSNGFKLKSTASLNYSGYTYIYAAFAENPFRNALAR